VESGQFGRTGEFDSEIHHLLEQINRNNQVYEQACVAFFGVTTSQGGTLLSLTPKSTISMNELSSAVGVDNSTMTRMVDQLVDKELVFRKTDEKDRRLVRIGLTSAGQKLHQKLAGALAGFYKDSLDQIPETERTVIIRSLETLNNAIAQGLQRCCERYCGTQSKKESEPNLKSMV
jgi:DNA-binding MarR family transcriptional regulator